MQRPLINDGIGGYIEGSPLPEGFFGSNYCINGNFNICQRGTSFTNPASGAYTADRINQWFDTNGGTPPTITHSRQILTPGELNKSFYFYRINANGAGSSYGTNSAYIFCLQQIENGTRLLCGLNKKVTVSFYIRSDIAGRVVALEPIQRYGTGGSPSGEEYLTALRITCNTTWTKVAYTFTTNTLSGKTFGTNNDDRFLFQLWLQGGSTYNSRTGGTISWASGNIDIAQIQINAGDTALDYVAPIPTEEYRKCQRYYYKESQYYRIYVNQTSPSSCNFIHINYPNLLRTNATPVISGGVMAGHHANAPTLSNYDVSGFCASWTGSDYRNTDGIGYVNFSVDAEF